MIIWDENDHKIKFKSNKLFPRTRSCQDSNQKNLFQELLAVYQKSIVPIADVLLPNQFEAEKLTGMPIKCEADGWQVRLLVKLVRSMTII